jgi:hypothetical protein
MRAKIEALQGMLVFLAVAFLATSGFILSAHLMKLPLLVSWPPAKSADASSYWWILSLFPLLALYFWFINQSTRANSEQDAPSNGG